ncbi:hypothetical protein Thiosp_01662 [Thiorhodovibrio litoralis]|nr:hypothetical protein Thiosp_01662 [Thiorhodovibrio litoralis]
MSAADYYAQVNTLFIAYMGRPPSPDGLEYYAQKLDASDGNYLILVDDFYKSDEGKAYYDGLDPKDQVNQVFQNVFGRDAAPAGETYWAGLVSNNEISVAEMAYTIAYNASAADTAELDAKREASTLFTDAMTEDGLSFDTPESKAGAQFFLESVTAADAAEAVLSAQMASQFNAADIQGLLDSCIRLVEIGNTNPTAIQAMLADGGAGFAGALANANLSAEQVGELLVAMAEAEVATPGSVKAALADFDGDLGAFFDAIDSDTEITELVTVFNDAADTGSTAGLGGDVEEILNPTTDTGTTGAGTPTPTPTPTPSFTAEVTDGMVTFDYDAADSDSTDDLTEIARINMTLDGGTATFEGFDDADASDGSSLGTDTETADGFDGIDISNLKDAEPTRLDLSALVVNADNDANNVDFGIKLADFDTDANNKSDLSTDGGQKSNQTVVLPNLADIQGTMVIENMTVASQGTDGLVKNDVLDFSATSCVTEAAKLNSWIDRVFITNNDAEDGYVNLDIDLNDDRDAGALVLQNVMKDDLLFDALNGQLDDAYARAYWGSQEGGGPDNAVIDTISEANYFLSAIGDSSDGYTGLISFLGDGGTFAYAAGAGQSHQGPLIFESPDIVFRRGGSGGSKSSFPRYFSFHPAVNRLL